MKNILKEPLLHFLVGGFLLFMLFSFVGDDVDEQGGKLIIVNEESLLSFVQFRSRAFEPSVAKAKLAAMTDKELQDLIDQFVREESLYREAKSLGLDANDFIIRQRLIKSVEFITEDFIDSAIELTDEEVNSYYEDNKGDYFVEPHITFTHVFFDSEKHGRTQALSLAKAQLQALNADQVPFENSTQFGDRFPYHVNYVERGDQFVAGHFGAKLTASLFEIPADKVQWQGPFESAYGFHLVLLIDRMDGFPPPLEEIRDRVYADAKRLRTYEQKDAAIKRIINSYEVETQPLNFTYSDDSGVKLRTSNE